MPYTVKIFKKRLDKLKGLYTLCIFSEAVKKKISKLHNELDAWQNRQAKEYNGKLREKELEYINMEIDIIEESNKKVTIIK